MYHVKEIDFTVRHISPENCISICLALLYAHWYLSKNLASYPLVHHVNVYICTLCILHAVICNQSWDCNG